MCMSKPKTPVIQKVEATPAPPPPADTATTLREPDSASRDSTSLTQKRRGRNALRITRDSTVSTNVPASGSGVNV